MRQQLFNEITNFPHFYYFQENFEYSDMIEANYNLSQEIQSK